MEEFFRDMVTGWRLGIVATIIVVTIGWAAGWGYSLFGAICLLLGATLEKQIQRAKARELIPAPVEEEPETPTLDS